MVETSFMNTAKNNSNFTLGDEINNEVFIISVDPHILFLYSLSFRVVITGIVSTAGTITNVINIIVFYRQGLFSDSCNASLAALALADGVNCVFVLWGSVCYSIAHFAKTPSINFYRLCYFTSDRAVLLGSQIICFITTYIAFERFFSVVFPFKVKAILTTKRTYAFICVIVVLTTICYVPWLANSHLGWVQHSPNDSYILDYIGNEKLLSIVITWIVVNPISMRIAALVIVLVCNFTIHFKVHMSQQFRKSSSHLKQKQTSSSVEERGVRDDVQSKTTSKKEAKLSRMITVICTMFLFGYITDTTLALSVRLGLLASFSYDLILALYEFSTFCFTANSSCNIIVYYTMSTRYRQDFRRLFCHDEKKK